MNAPVLWFTGLPGAGKTTLARAVAARLRDAGRPCGVVDGDELRRTVSRDLGFGPSDRREQARRAATIAAGWSAQGVAACCALVSPHGADRAWARSLCPPGTFHEIHVATAAEICAARDRKGLWRRAAAGDLPGLTGMDAPYEAPVGPELRLDLGLLATDAAADRVLELILTAAAQNR